jgi:hypothetical protein
MIKFWECPATKEQFKASEGTYSQVAALESTPAQAAKGLEWDFIVSGRSKLQYKPCNILVI